ncbi:MAG: hypothetical protein H6509_15935, partial [Bryobacterales bacterium]|nr:hypothetical protein [Bryobacterales bacterium]
MSKPNRKAIDKARLLTMRYLEEVFPGFLWRMPTVKRQKLGRMPIVEAVELLDAGSAERDRAGWDFAFVITQSDIH